MRTKHDTPSTTDRCWQRISPGASHNASTRKHSKMPKFYFTPLASKTTYPPLTSEFASMNINRVEDGGKSSPMGRLSHFYRVIDSVSLPILFGSYLTQMLNAIPARRDTRLPLEQNPRGESVRTRTGHFLPKSVCTVATVSLFSPRTAFQPLSPHLVKSTFAVAVTTPSLQTNVSASSSAE